MPFNGSGVFQRVRNWVADATAGIKIRADYHDAEDNGFADGLTNCITKDGQTIVTQNIPMNSKRITGLQDPVNPQDAATMAWAMPKAGGKLTGDLEIEKNSPLFTLDDTTPVDQTSAGNQISGLRVGKQRWLLRLGNGTPETGANAGSDFDIHRYDDGGAHLGSALTINRASGAWGVNTSLTVNGTAIVNSTLNVGNDGATGLIYLGNSGQRHLYYNGTRYQLAGAPTYVESPIVGTDAANKAYVDGRTTFTPVQQGGAAGMLDNKIYIGWSGGQLIGQVDTVPLGQFMFGSAMPVINARLTFAGDLAAATGPQSSPYEPYPGGVITGWQWAIVGYATVTAFRIRYMQLYTTSWFTIGYA